MTVFFIFLLFLFVVIADSKRVVRAATMSERLWGISQQCDFEIENPQNSILGLGETFDNQTAACTGAFADDHKIWQVTAFQPTGLAYIENVRLEVRFFVTGLTNDRVTLEIFDGSQWKAIQEYGSGDRTPPAALETLGLDVSAYLNSPEKINQASVRFRGKKKQGREDAITILLDGARLIVNGAIEPTATPTPPDLPSATPTLLPTASSTATPPPSLTPTSTTIGMTPTPLESSPTPEITQVAPGLGSIQTLWGIEQACAYAITNPELGLDQQFDDQTASCSGEFAADKNAWQYTAFQHTSFTFLENSLLEARFSVGGLVDDNLNLEIFDGFQWHLLRKFDGKSNKPLTGLVTLGFDVSKYLDSPEKVNLVSVRFVGEKDLSQPDRITISVDGMRLVVTGRQDGIISPTVTGLPTVTPSPTPSSTPVQPTPTGTITATIIFTPWERRLPLPTPTIPSSVAAAPRVAGDPHGDITGMADGCAGCHSSHAAGGIELRHSWPEESLCNACHAGVGSGTNVETSFSSYTNTNTRFFKHDVAAANGLHHLDEASGSDFGGGNRHIECEDCHEPHYAARGDSNPPALQLEMTGISGVEPVWAGPGAPVAFTSLTEADREYQVCFKCHSSFTSLPTYSPDGWNGNAYVANGLQKLTNTNPVQVPDQRDLAQSFNPNQASFHPVVTLGRNQNIPADTFVNDWSQSSMTYCTDCHDNANASTQSDGPHGSPRLHILKGQANYSTVYQSSTPKVSAQEVCFICHNYQTYVTGQTGSSNFNEHRRHLNEDWGTTCYTCHNSHGSEQLHLINFDASVVTFLNGTNSQTAWYPATGNGRAGCTLICHGDRHDPETYGPGG